MNCVRCGTAIADGAAFCANCGAQVTDPGGATVAIAIGQEDKLLSQLRTELASEYKVEKELGRGGMAVVYKAIELGLERTVALKVVPPEMAMVGNTADRFKREAKMAAALDHPNIIPVYRVGQAGQLFYMAMKFIEGRALDAVIESQGALPMPVVLNVLRGASSACAFAHENGIVHRDIKGANILIDKDGRVVVSDFGIARAMEDKSLTASGMVIGTPYFMSPEQCGGAKVGPQSDQYSLAIVGFQMLTGSVPFEADSMMGIIQHHYLTPPPDITNVRPGVPEQLLEIIYRALNKDPADRFETTREFAEAIAAIPESDEDRREGDRLLRQLSHGEKIPQIRTGSLPPLTLSAPAAMTPPPAAPKPRTLTGGAPVVAKKQPTTKSPALIAAGVVLLLAMGGGGWYAMNRTQTSTTADAATTGGAADPGAPGASEKIAAAQAPAEVLGSVRFIGNPAGARISVAGEPLRAGIGMFRAGSHRYSISAPGYVTRTGSVDIIADQTQNISYNLQPEPVQQPATASAAPSTPSAPAGAQGKLRVAAEPLDAEIFVDGKRVGRGRVVDASLGVGRHSIRITANGFETHESTFTVEQDATANLGKITLKPQG
jgi:serine/threonine protein kinase